jgi:hypothetical protein
MTMDDRDIQGIIAGLEETLEVVRARKCSCDGYRLITAEEQAFLRSETKRIHAEFRALIKERHGRNLPDGGGSDE